jgi:hypothetical protein
MSDGPDIPAADIYVQELEHLVWGYPVYCPHKEIHIGDVGFFRRDRPDHPFERLFNVLCDADDPANATYGVPAGFEKYQDFLKNKHGIEDGPHYDIDAMIHPSQELMSKTGVTRDVKMKVGVFVVFFETTILCDDKSLK